MEIHVRIRYAATLGKIRSIPVCPMKTLMTPRTYDLQEPIHVVYVEDGRG